MAYRRVFAFTGLLLLALTNVAAARLALFYIYPPQLVRWTTGETYSGHAANWWQWALTQPADVNPLLDTTGEFCDQGQAGGIWYLAGSLGEDVSRSCTVPAGKTLVFPIYNDAFLGFPPEAFPGYPGDTVQDVEDYVDTVPDRIGQVWLRIDGKDVDLSRFYEESEIFSVTLPDGNIYEDYGLPGGFELTPSGDGGYYVAVAPLLGGAHTLDFGATYLVEDEQGQAFEQSFAIHYDLNVRWY